MKKISGFIIFSFVIASIFFVKNMVSATLNPAGNEITGNVISGGNVASYAVNFIFSGTLDTGDSVYANIIDGSGNVWNMNFTASPTGGATGFNFPNNNISALLDGPITLSGSVIDSSGNLVTGSNVTSTTFKDTTPPDVPAATPDLGIATTFGVLASTYTDVAPTTTIINGDLGYSILSLTGSTVSGIIYISPDPAYTQAITGQSVALGLLNAEPCTWTGTGVTNLGTDTTHNGGGTPGLYEPGVYCTNGAVTATNITLSGAGTYIFRMDGTLGTTNGDHVALTNGALASDVFWTATGATTLAANTAFKGTIIDDAGITINNGATLIGRALSQGGTVTTDRATITVPNTTPPTVDAGLNIVTNHSVTIYGIVSGSVAGVASYLRSNEDSASGSLNIPGSVTNVSLGVNSASPDGTYTIGLLVTDNAGNTGYDTMELTWDTTAPTDQNSYISHDVGVTGGESLSFGGPVASGDTVWIAPAGTVGFTANGTTITMATAGNSIILAPTIGGTYYIYVTDEAGNASVASTYSVIVDNSAPTTPTLSLPANTGNLNTGTVNLLRNTSTDTNMSGYIWQLSTLSNFSTIYSSGSITATGTTITGLADDTYYWRVYAFDIVGNTGTRSSTWNFIVDTTPPYSITGTDITGGNVDSYTVVYTFTGILSSGNQVWVSAINGIYSNPTHYDAIGGESGSLTFSWGVGGIDDGIIITVRGYISSGGGIFSGSDVSIIVIKDTVAPTFAGVTSGAYYNTSKSITFSESNSGATATLSGASYTSGQNITGEGKYIFIVTDSFGNSTGATFTIDETVPTTPNLLLSGYLTTGTANLLRSTSIDIGDMSGYIWQLSTGSNFSPIYSSGSVTTTGKTITGLADTTYFYQVYAFDKAGNTGSRNSGSFIVDIAVPTATVTYSTTGTTNGNVTATVSGFSETVTGLNAGSYVFTSNGSYIFTFTDLAGNPGSITATVTWITTSNGGGGGGLVQDSCPNGDNSPSYYDGICGTNTNQQTNGSIIDSTYSTELNNAYLYAYGIGITTMGTIQNADMEGNLIRAHMAKMMVNYAIKVLGRTLNTGANCTFTDLAGQTIEMKNYILRSCQLGLMGINMNNKFNPNGEVTRAEFGTILSRTLYGAQYEGGILYYTNHLNALKIAGIMNNIKNPENIKEIRGYVMLMLMRAGE